MPVSIMLVPLRPIIRRLSVVAILYSSSLRFSQKKQSAQRRADKPRNPYSEDLAVNVMFSQ